MAEFASHQATEDSISNYFIEASDSELLPVEKIVDKHSTFNKARVLSVGRYRCVKASTSVRTHVDKPTNVSTHNRIHNR